MVDVFISYSTSDEPTAQFMHRHLLAEGVSTFLASASLQPGQQWSPEVLTALRSSGCVLFLASRAACASPWVQQELGVAIGANKKLIPVIWNIQPSELPGWVAGYQALDLANHSAEQVQARVAAIAAQIKANKRVALLIGVLAVAAVFAK